MNVTLVGMLRYACRGHAGRALQRNQGGGRVAALLRRMRPRWLLVPIRMTLFLCSMVYSSVVFFAWQVRPGYYEWYGQYGGYGGCHCHGICPWARACGCSNASEALL